MNGYEIAAVVGAFAWLPIVAQLLYWWLVKPKVDLVVGGQAEVGYSIFGAIVNIQCAIRSSRKRCLVTDVDLTLRHANGRQLRFAWGDVVETLSDARSTAGDIAFTNRTLQAVALQILPDELVPRWIRHRDREFLRVGNEQHSRVARRIDRIGHVADLPDQVLASDEWRDLIELYETAFPWEAGRYRCELTATVAELSSTVRTTLFFELTQRNVDDLRANLPMIRLALLELGTIPDPTRRTPERYNWAYPFVST